MGDLAAYKTPSQSTDSGDVKKINLPYLPEYGTLKNGRKIEFDRYKESDVNALHQIFNGIVDEGQTYPHLTPPSIEEFRQGYLGYEAFVARDAKTGEVLGAFYVKPNYIGRSSHICNGGFIVSEACRGQGIATFLVPRYLKVARDLGYLGSVFNLVYVTNEASVKLWETFGFTQIGRVPKAGNLKGLGFVDAIAYYYDLTTL